MEQIIKDMIEKAVYYYGQIDKSEEACDLIRFIKDLVDKMTNTINCPSNWRSIGEELADEYKDNSWVFNELELWNYIED